jgi:hypothetical protein
MEPIIPDNAIALTTDQRIQWVRQNRPELYAEHYAHLTSPHDYRTARALEVCNAQTHLNALVRLAPLAPLIQEVEDELIKATGKFPTWPTDPIHAAGVVNEECGELSREVLQLVYEPHKSSPTTVREEAVQLAAMAFRFLRSMSRYDWTPGVQHDQNWAEELQK